MSLDELVEPRGPILVRRSTMVDRFLIRCRLCGYIVVGHEKTPGQAGDKGRSHLAAKHRETRP